MTEKEIYIFCPEDYTTEELWQIVQEREQLNRDGFIGDCLMRRLANREARCTHTALNMEAIANRALAHLLRHYFPFRFRTYRLGECATQNGEMHCELFKKEENT